MLLQCASPDAIARLPATQLRHYADEIWREYFKNQKHASLKDYLVHNCLGDDKDSEHAGSLVQVSFLNKIGFFRLARKFNQVFLIFRSFFFFRVFEMNIILFVSINLA